MKCNIHLHLEKDRLDSAVAVKVVLSIGAENIFHKLDIDKKKVSSKLADVISEILTNDMYKNKEEK